MSSSGLFLLTDKWGFYYENYRREITSLTRSIRKSSIWENNSLSPYAWGFFPYWSLYIGEIPNEAITTPSNALSTLLYKIDKSGIPINIKEVGIDSFKRLLLEMCIREARWIGKHPNSLKLQKVPIEEFEQTFDYGLKDITKLDDFNQVVDWQNSSFYQTSTENSNKTWYINRILGFKTWKPI